MIQVRDASMTRQKALTIVKMMNQSSTMIRHRILFLMKIAAKVAKFWITKIKTMSQMKINSKTTFIKMSPFTISITINILAFKCECTSKTDSQIKFMALIYVPDIIMLVTKRDLIIWASGIETKQIIQKLIKTGLNYTKKEQTNMRMV